MISLSVTPFTDLPTHRSIRSCFTKNCSNEKCHESATFQLSHLWSEERQHQESKFDALIAELDTIAEELGVSPSNSCSSGTSSSKSLAVDSLASGREGERIYSYMGWSSVHPMRAYTDLCTSCQGEEEWFKTSEEEQQHHWLIDMNAKVQTLLQEAHQVLGSTPPAQLDAYEKHFGPDLDMSNGGASTGTDDGDASLGEISLYMQEEGSFTSEGPTLLEDGQDSYTGHDDAGVIESRSDGDWLLGNTSTETAGTSSDSQDFLKERGHGETLMDTYKLTETSAEQHICGLEGTVPFN